MGSYKQNLYIIQDKQTGKEINVWGKTQLDQLMEEIEIKDYIRLTYNGIKKTQNGHQMKIYNLERRIKDE